MPPEGGVVAAPVMEASDGPPVSLPADPASIIAQPITDQVAETTSEMKSLIQDLYLPCH